jgi:hypothetical protein
LLRKTLRFLKTFKMFFKAGEFLLGRTEGWMASFLVSHPASVATMGSRENVASEVELGFITRGSAGAVTAKK